MLPSGAPFERYLVKTAFLSTTHGSMACSACHQGDPGAAERSAAHAGLVARPSRDPGATCGTCHAAEVTAS